MSKGKKNNYKVVGSVGSELGSSSAEVVSCGRQEWSGMFCVLQAEVSEAMKGVRAGLGGAVPRFTTLCPPCPLGKNLKRE